MLSLFCPTDGDVRRQLSEQSLLGHSYPELCATRDARGNSIPGMPASYVVDHNRLCLGTGRATFERAKAAIRRWQMFDLPWVRLCWPSAPIECGSTVGILAQSLGLWSLNFCRITYTIDEPGEIERFGFGYGTLPDHMKIGEERFVVEFDCTKGSNGPVWYDLLAFSRPGHWISRLAHSHARRVQHAFARGSKDAMTRAVAEP